MVSRTSFFLSPSYTASILGSGRVNYRRYDRVHWKGKRHARISHDAVEQLVEHVRASNFFDLPGSYDNEPCLSNDGSEGSLHIRLDGREKSVGTCGAPPIVDQLMTEVESAAQVWRWVVIDPDELHLKIAHEKKDVTIVGRVAAKVWDVQLNTQNQAKSFTIFVISLESKGQNKQPDKFVQIVYSYSSRKQSLPDSFFDYTIRYRFRAVRDPSCDGFVTDMRDPESENSSGVAGYISTARGAPDLLWNSRLPLDCVSLEPRQVQSSEVNR
jgi:hypothetical protein